MTKYKKSIIHTLKQEKKSSLPSAYHWDPTFNYPTALPLRRTSSPHHRPDHTQLYLQPHTHLHSPRMGEKAVQQQSVQVSQEQQFLQSMGLSLPQVLITSDWWRPREQ